MGLADAIRRGRRVRAIGFDDAPFDKKKRGGDVNVCGVICSGTRFEGMLWTRVRRDGWNATDRVIDALSTSKFMDQLHLVLIDGIAFGGFNVLDLPRLHRELGLPVVSVIRRHPDFESVRNAIEMLPRASKRWTLIEAGGPVHESETHVWFQAHGEEPEVVSRALVELTDTGHMPEPIRLAHLIGSAVITGESGRRA